MELANWLRREPAAEISVDFSDVERFEAFGVEVLFRELVGLKGAGATVRYRGIPPCVSERLDALGIAVMPSPRHPRWAPWAP
jgi:anti-anti-sigma regulatory factor